MYYLGTLMISLLPGIVFQNCSSYFALASSDLKSMAIVIMNCPLHDKLKTLDKDKAVQLHMVMLEIAPPTLFTKVRSNEIILFVAFCARPLCLSDAELLDGAKATSQL